MRLYTNPASPFSRKVRVIAHALGIKLEEVQVNPLEDPHLRQVNPLGMIPALVLDDGKVLIDSRVIAEYLDTQGGGNFFPEGDTRWRALALQALGDGIGEAAVSFALLGRETPPPVNRRARQSAAIEAGLAALEETEFADPPTVREIAVASALIYVDLRLADLDWKASHPRLAAWFETFLHHPLMQAAQAA